ncbi:GTP-binding protein [Isoalcanivorax beigongshangi]|uniref:ATP/GTP-binding protein n=1 Tax=Isoalcanivorax beigongshangi TaxID=3238810 RepID=A0ABV4AI02_9GAMM
MTRIPFDSLAALQLHRILFIGSFGVGKTTAIQTLSDIPVVGSEAAISSFFDGTREAATAAKSTTTVAFDYGEIQVEARERYALLGVPGQQRFAHMWQSLLPSVLGAVLLINPHNPDEPEHVRDWLQRLRSQPRPPHVVLGVTRIDVQDQATLDRYQALADALMPGLPVFAVDPRRADHMRWSLGTVLALAEGDALPPDAVEQGDT